MQRTIGTDIAYSGCGLHIGRPATFTIKPAPADSGICFRRVDLSGTPQIKARAENVVDTARCTVLGNAGGVRVMTVEHLLSALAGFGIDNAIIDVDGPEIPIADGSALPFSSLIAQAGVTEQAQPRRVRRLDRPVAVTCGRSYAAAIPSESFKISMTLVNDHRHPALSDQYFEIEPDPASYPTEVAPARTFAFMVEVEALRRQGLIQGGTPDCAIVVGETELLTSLRFPDEMVRHKALDLMGDLALLGPIQAHIIGVRTSHKLNNQLALALSAALI
jgi:UDP-3-O-[3-hydroxymyristoyl] N-acetylglucosamine deacetylase